ncbi:MAG: AbrB/MazE/SpoVT family DNA-binding domain-containing protein [Bacilli bacterium]|nr:AbrB/MazE/SpoVT family DNA-binding domain-containing protein [Bacilli bacterium]
MKIVRRIDELGRIVLPKDLREALRIKSGDNLEIFIENKNIVLKKHSKLNKIKDIEKIITEILKEKLNTHIILTDTDKIIIDTSNKSINEKISKEVEQIIINKEQITKEEIKITKVKIINSLIKPIVKEGKAIGALIVPNKKELSETEKIIIDVLINFLIKYIE